MLAFHSFAAEATADLAAAKTRHEMAIAAATKPLKERYAQELQQLKARAMLNKNLELAVAVDAEIKTLAGPQAAPSPTAILNNPKLNDFANLTIKLLGTPWSWELLPDHQYRKLKAGVEGGTGTYTVDADGRIRLGESNGENFVPKTSKKGIFYKDGDDKTPKGEVAIDVTKKK